MYFAQFCSRNELARLTLPCGHNGQSHFDFESDFSHARCNFSWLEGNPQQYFKGALSAVDAIEGSPSVD